MYRETDVRELRVNFARCFIKEMRYGCSIELFHRGDFNKYPQLKVFKKKYRKLSSNHYQLLSIYLVFCQTASKI